MGLVSTTYFDSITHGMVVAGFSLISRVVIGDKDRPYHVPATIARDTRLIFHVLGKRIIIVLAFHENDYFRRGKIEGYWKIHIYTESLPYQEILKLQMDGLNRPDLMNWEKLELVRSAEEQETIPEGFRPAGMYISGEDEAQFDRSYEQERPFAAPLEVDKVVGICVSLRETLAQFAAAGAFDRLQVTDFPPHYTFPGCESLFWGRFDTKYFKSVVRDPWGSGPGR